MKIFILLIFIAAAAMPLAAQLPSPPAGSRIGSVHLARDDGKGKPGEEVSSFTVTDIPIHCVVSFDEPKAASVKMIFVAVDVPGVRRDSKVVTTTYTKKASETSVNFTGRPFDRWHAGKYRVDIYIDGKLAADLAFDIRSPAVPAAGSSFAPAKAPVRTPKKQ